MILAGVSFAGVSSFGFSGLGLPAGSVLVVVACEYPQAADRYVSQVSHPSLSGVSRIGGLYQAVIGSQGYTIEVWGGVSSGGSGNLNVQINGGIDFGAAWVLGVSGLGELGRVTRQSFGWTSSFALNSPAAGFGVAVVYGPMGTETSTVDITGWDDGTDLRKPGNWRAGRVAFEANATQGQQVNFVGNGGSINPLAMLCVFGSGGGNAALIRGI